MEPTVSVTFDNLGEAAEMEMGAWPQDRPLGEHFSVVEVLPRVLELLASHSVAASFFVEGINAQLYPDALRSLQDAGHEVAVHAWRHEDWGALDRDREAELLTRTAAAMTEAGLRPTGFRPPGGRLTQSGTRLLAEHGYRYVSPAGRREGLLDGLAVLPFRWPLVDAFWFMPGFEGLRRQHGRPEEAASPEQVRDAMVAAVDAHASSPGGHLVLLFHPFALTVDGDEGWSTLDEVLRRVATAGCGAERMDQAAERMLSHPREYGLPPELDESTWMASAE